jgi:hypothetical protein
MWKRWEAGEGTCHCLRGHTRYPRAAPRCRWVAAAPVARRPQSGRTLESPPPSIAAWPPLEAASSQDAPPLGCRSRSAAGKPAPSPWLRAPACLRCLAPTLVSAVTSGRAAIHWTRRWWCSRGEAWAVVEYGILKHHRATARRLRRRSEGVGVCACGDRHTAGIARLTGARHASTSIETA